LVMIARPSYPGKYSILRVLPGTCRPHTIVNEIIISPDFGPGRAKAGGEFKAS
jgi:hypothetical protein